MSEIALTIRMLSDWHIGAGAGDPPIIDRSVVRDADGLPVIPAGTIKGIWRDSAEALISSAPNSERWSPWLERLFGSRISIGQAPENKNTGAPPIQGHVNFSAAKLPKKFVKELKKLPEWPEVAETLFLLRRHTRLDKHGQVVPETLRTIEFVRGDLRFETQAFLPSADTSESGQNSASVNDEIHRAMRAILICSAFNIERLGGQRRRGAGRCAVVVDGVDSEALDRLFDVLEKSPPEAPSRQSTYILRPASKEQNPADNGARPVVTFDIKLELKQPVSCATRQLGNLQTCLDYLPGRALAKPILAALCDLAPKHPWWREFADGNVVIANGYPDIDGIRGVPAPSSLYYDKGQRPEGDKLYNLMWQSADEIKDEIKRKDPKNAENYYPQLKVLVGGYLPPDRRGLTPLAAQKILVQRNAVDHESQRPTATVGGIYSREAIAAWRERANGKMQPVVYRAVLRLSGDAYKSLQNKTEKVQDALNERFIRRSIRIGGGAPGCGEVRMRAEYRSEYPEPQPQGNSLLVYFASDVILDAQALSLAPLEEVLIEALNQVLKEDAHVRPPNAGRIDVALRTRLDGGWNPRWGLPKEAAIVLSAGSCLMLERERAFELDELKKLQQRGLGKRRGEGYGELICNPPLLMADNSGADRE